MYVCTYIHTPVVTYFTRTLSLYLNIFKRILYHKDSYIHIIDWKIFIICTCIHRCICLINCLKLIIKSLSEEVVWECGCMHAKKIVHSCNYYSIGMYSYIVCICRHII